MAYALNIAGAAHLLVSGRSSLFERWGVILNPFTVTFLAAVVLAGSAYGGIYRFRDALAILFILGFSYVRKHRASLVLGRRVPLASYNVAGGYLLGESR
jgi:hypothetical protein